MLVFGIKVWQQAACGVVLGDAGGDIWLLFRQPKQMTGDCNQGPINALQETESSS